MPRSQTRWLGSRRCPAVEEDAPAAGLQHAGDGADQRRLAGAVRADDGDDLARVDLERHAGERLRRRRSKRSRSSMASVMRRLRAEIDSSTRRIAHDVVRRAPRRSPRRGASTRTRLRQRHHRAHHVLDQQDGHAVLARSGRARSPPSRRSRSGAVRPSPRRAAAACGCGGERARHLEPLAVGQGQAARPARLSEQVEAAQQHRRRVRARRRRRACAQQAPTSAFSSTLRSGRA